MKICLPVDRADGLESEISPSFRAAPALLLIDSASGEQRAIDTSAGSCSAIPAGIDAIVCAGGIGRGLFGRLVGQGVRVYFTDAVTVGEALAELGAGRLEPVGEVACCGGGHHHHHAHGEDGQGAAGGCGCGGSAQVPAEEKSGACCGHH